MGGGFEGRHRKHRFPVKKAKTQAVTLKNSIHLSEKNLQKIKKKTEGKR